MRKILIISLFMTALFMPVGADDITDDFLDIAANYYIQGLETEAINYIDKAIAHEPSDENLKEIKKCILRIRDNNAQSYLNSSNTSLKTANEFKKSGNKQKEFETLTTGALARDPWAVYYLAEYYRTNKQYNNALDYYDKALDIRTGFAQCYLGITLTLMEMKNYEAALNAIAYYLDKCPKSDFGYALRAEINMNLKNYVDAEADIITALSISDDIEYKLLEAKILYNRGNYKPAKEKFEALSVSAKTAEIYKYTGLCDYALKDYNNALLNLNNAIILSDDDTEITALYNEVKSKFTGGS